MVFVNKVILENLKEYYPVGTRVKLVSMDDPQAPAKGSFGTVIYVDSTGTIHVSWDCGSSLGVIYGEDKIEKVEKT